tara:strand:- start:3840 stop:4076 length:237 start_codon:yes stop_codon:yes gene_type:complete
VGKHETRKTFSWDVFLPDDWTVDDPVHFLPRDGSAHFVDADCPCNPILQEVEGGEVLMYKHRAEIENESVPTHLPPEL